MAWCSKWFAKIAPWAFVRIELGIKWKTIEYPNNAWPAISYQTVAHNIRHYRCQYVGNCLFFALCSAGKPAKTFRSSLFRAVYRGKNTIGSYKIFLFIFQSNYFKWEYIFFFQNTASNEKLLKFSPEEKDITVATKDITDQQQKDAIKNIILRNRGLRLLHALLFTPRNTVNHHLCDDISRILGLDWLLLLLQPQIHSSTVILGEYFLDKSKNDFFMDH